MSKILIVEDDELTLDLYTKLFCKEGYEVVSALDGNTAISKLHSERPDVVLLDLLLPDMNGVEVLKIIRRQAAFHDLPVIVVSVGYVNELLLGAKEAGATSILTKGDSPLPIIVQKVRQAIGHLLHNGDKRILIVEDDNLIAEIYSKIFMRAGFHVDIASEGAVALSTIRIQKPDAILLDLMLPKVNGIAFLKMVRSQPDLLTLPIIVYSVGYNEQMMQEAREAGATYVLTKGDVPLDDLVKQIRLLLANPSAAPSEQTNPERT